MPRTRNELIRRQTENATTTTKRCTRAEAARVLGLSLSGVRYLERSGSLRSRVDEAGVHTFARRAVEALVGKVKPRASTTATAEQVSAEGATAARAFALLEAGGDWRELVRVLEVTPARARELAELYRQPGELVLPPAVVAELAALGVGDAAGVVTGRGVVAVVRRLRERLRAARGARRVEH